jgi:hypothetical protein
MPDDQIEHCLTFAFARYVAPSAGGCKPQVGIAQLSAYPCNPPKKPDQQNDWNRDPNQPEE